MTMLNITCPADLQNEDSWSTYSTLGIGLAAATAGAIAHFGWRIQGVETARRITSLGREYISGCLRVVDPRQLAASAVRRVVSSVPFRSACLVLASYSASEELARMLLDRGPIYDWAMEYSLRAAAFQEPDGAMLHLLDPTGVIRERLRQQDRERSLGQYHWYIENFQEVKSDPLRFLNQIAKNGFPRIVHLQGSAALDSGGLRKQLLTTLFKGLDTLLEITTDRLPVIDPDNPKAINLYEILGKCFSELRSANERRPLDPFLIGSFFNPRFFDIVKICLEVPDHNERVLELARFLPKIDPTLQTTADLLLDPYNPEKHQAYSSMLHCELEDCIHIARAVFTQYLTPAQSFLQGCDKTLMEILRKETSDQISSRFQGAKVTAENLLSSLRFESSEEGIFADQISWLQEAIQESTPEWREALIFWVTGKTTLSLSTELKIQSTFTQDFCVHTCTNTIDLPKEALDKKAFLFSLNQQLENLGFTLA